jgi:hypothetical protein
MKLIFYRRSSLPWREDNESGWHDKMT